MTIHYPDKPNRAPTYFLVAVGCFLSILFGYCVGMLKYRDYLSPDGLVQPMNQPR